jgi:hypothetical protein
VPDYKIRYKDRRMQLVTADNYGVYGDFFVFHCDGSQILSVAKDGVEAVGLAELADPVSRMPRSAAV